MGPLILLMSNDDLAAILLSVFLLFMCNYLIFNIYIKEDFQALHQKKNKKEDFQAKKIP
jgi:hypothetical protein